MHLLTIALGAASLNAAHAGVDVDWSACKTEPLSLPADIDKAKAAVLSVHTDDGLGSAVVVAPDGTALTAAHVVGALRTVQVKNTFGMELEAEVLYADEDSDIAVLDVAGKGHRCLPPGFERLAAGVDVFAIGSPAGAELAFSISKGVVSGYPNVDDKPFLQTDASLNPGNSGGPILGPDGRVSGIVSWKVAAKEFEGLGFGVPMDVVRETLVGPDGVKGGVLGGVMARADLGKVNFSSPREGVTIGVVTAEARASQYGPMAGFQPAQIKDLCIAPCTKEFSPKLYSFVAYSDTLEPVRLKVDVHAGETLDLVAMPRHRAVVSLGSTLGSLGMTTALVGGVLWAVGSGTPESNLAGTGKTTTLVGAAAGVGGITLLFASKGKWENAAKSGGLGVSGAGAGAAD